MTEDQDVHEGLEEELGADVDVDVDVDVDLGDELELGAGETSEVGDVASKPPSRDDYSDAPTESLAVRANPKRQQARRKTGKVLQKFSDVDLNKTDGQTKVWNALREGAELSTAKAYSITHSFAENDTVEHSKFGVGFVVEELSDTKLLVLFEDGLRKMMCNYPSP